MSSRRRPPHDVRYLEWAGKDGFYRARAEWLQLHRWDAKLLPATMTVLAEIAARMAYDKDCAWPSIPRLGAELSMSERTVRRAVEQAIERGWLICEKRGFGGSNHYAMAASSMVTEEVIADHDRRVAAFVETRSGSLRPSVASMENPASIAAIHGPSLRPSVASHSGHLWPLNEATHGPLTYSLNLATEPNHGTYAGRLGEGRQDYTPPEIDPSKKSRSSSAAADERLRAHEELILVLGQGDFDRGRLFTEALGSRRMADLDRLVHEAGIVGAAPDIEAARRDAESTLRFQPARAEA